MIGSGDSEDVDFSNEANERLTCSYEGDSMEIGFNSRFLNEMLQNIDSRNFRLRFQEGSKVVITFLKQILF